MFEEPLILDLNNCRPLSNKEYKELSAYDQGYYDGYYDLMNCNKYDHNTQEYLDYEEGYEEGCRNS